MCIILIGSGWTESLHTNKGSHRKNTKRAAQPSGGGEQRRSEEPQQVLYWGSGQSTQQRHGGISLEHLTITRSQSEGKKENSWQRLTLSHWGTWPPWQGAHSLLVKQEDKTF